MKKSPERGKTMKALFVATLCISLVFYAGEAFSQSDEILCTWVNSKYVSDNPPQKLILNYDGTFECYATKTSTDAIKRGVFQIIKKWEDSEKNIWYQIKMHDPKYGTKFKLARISNNGNILEFVCQPNEFPAEISTTDPNYCRYMREST